MTLTVADQLVASLISVGVTSGRVPPLVRPLG